MSPSSLLLSTAAPAASSAARAGSTMKRGHGTSAQVASIHSCAGGKQVLQHSDVASSPSWPPNAAVLLYAAHFSCAHPWRSRLPQPEPEGFEGHLPCSPARAAQPNEALSSALD